MKIKRLDHVNFITNDPQATIDFYCDIIGLNVGKRLPTDTMKTIYFYIPGESISILHVGNAKAKKNKETFKRFADLDIESKGAFSTGAFDHFCLATDISYYNQFICRLEARKIEYQTYSHGDELKQIWLLDPNGVRVELNFTP